VSTNSLLCRLGPLALILTLCAFGPAQTAPASRITQPINDAVRVPLKGNVHPLAQARFDLGTVSDSFPASRMLLLLRRSPEREAALQQFLEDAHRPGSAIFHKWIKPDQFGELYGLTDSEIATVSGWLQEHGFVISRINRARTAIEFSGTAGGVRSAFHTQIHAYFVNGHEHYANDVDPQVPAALAPVIVGITPINNFRPKSYITSQGKAVYDSRTKKFVPDWTFPAGQDLLDLSPGDFALQYDLGPLYASGMTGTGITIGLIGASNVDPTAVANYRSFFGLPANPLNVVIDGTDPGENDAVGESYLDVELSGAVAPGATINLYTAADTSVQSGLYLAAQRAVDDDEASILSTSYGTCEQDLGSAGNQFWYSLWEQATAQGQTSFVSAGDGGPAGCDDFDNEGPAQLGIAVNGFSSTPWNVSVGGTDFYYSSYNQNSSAQQTQIDTYWDTVPTIFPTTSLLQPVPEQPWNRSFGLNLYDGGVYNSNFPQIVAGSGGPSSCSSGTDAADGSYSSCTAGYPKPSWQTGQGVPNDGVRDLPDVSLFAAAGENDTLYPFCPGEGFCVVTDGDLTIGIVGGTSASSPAMAGILALIEQKYGPQGQADYILYPLAAQHPAAFHDITTGSNIVPCEQGTPNCTLSTASDNTKGYYTFGFYAGAGYDLATGLGSVDANQLFNSWNSLSFKSSTTSLSLSQTTFTHGTPVTVSVGVSGSGGTPTGGVDLLSSSTSQEIVGLKLLTLQSGAANASVNSLPGGQYQVTARYGGDSVFASSTSSPVSVNVAPEASKLSLFGSYYSFDSNTSGTLANGGSYPVGTAITVEAQAVGVNAPAGSTDGIATGTVTFTDTASTGTVSSGPLNMGSSSTAEWVPTFTVGSHSLSANYSGDPSFNASSITTALNFTVTKAIPGTALSANPSAGAHGQNIMLQLIIGASVPPAPTGTVTFYLGNTVLGTAPVEQTIVTYPYTNSAATLNLTNLPVGADSITAKYSGDSNYDAVTASAVQVTVSQQPAGVLTASANAASLLPTQNLTVTAYVAGVSGQPTPTGSIEFYAYGPGGSYSASCNLVNGSCNFDFGDDYWSPGVVTVDVGYSGDTNYAGSSVVVPVTMLNMFNMTAASSVSFAAGATTGNSSSLTVTPVNGFTGPVYFACTIAYYPPAAQHLPTCSVPSSVSVTSATAVTSSMTISSTATTTVSQAKEIRGARWLAAQSLVFVAGILVVGLPRRRRVRLHRAACCLLLVLVGSVAWVSCGGGGMSTGGGHTVPGTTPGTYKFMVDGAYTPNESINAEPLFFSTPQVFVVTVNIQ
jgi:Pro-kumamolisin, activation domain/Bacterial Ig-like domain (group 3)